MANTKITPHVLDSTLISGHSTVTAATNDFVLIQDVSDSNALKKALVSDLAQNEESPTFTGNVSVGGTLSVTGETTLETHLNMGDSDIIKLGAGADLQIQHNGSDSLIGESGTGDLYIYGENNIYLTNNVSGSENYLSATKDGAVTLFYDNTAELVTISGGVKVNNKLGVNSNASNAALEVVATSGEVFRADANNGAYRLVANQDGVIMNPKVGIGQSSPDTILHIGDGTSNYVRIENAGSGDVSSGYQIYRGSSVGMSLYDNPADNTTSLLCAGSLNINAGGSGADLHVNTNGNVGVGNSNPQHPFIVHLSDGEVAMFGSNAMNSVGSYAGIGLGQVLANNTTYQKISIVAEGRNSGSYVSNLHFLVDTAADGGTAVLSDSKMMVSGASGHVGIGSNLMSYQAGGTDLHPLYVQTTASNGTVATNGFVHFGPTSGGNSNADGYITGISLGYHENNASYQHSAIGVRSHGDGAARRDMVFLLNTAVESASASLGDAKLTISSGSGVVSGDLNDTSDLGFKENVADLGNTLSIVNQLKPRTFTWKDRRANRGDSVGFIAQEVKSVISDNTLVQGEEYDPDNLKMTGLSINTVGLVAYLTKAIQELSAKNDALEARITTLEG